MPVLFLRAEDVELRGRCQLFLVGLALACVLIVALRIGGLPMLFTALPLGLQLSLQVGVFDTWKVTKDLGALACFFKGDVLPKDRALLPFSGRPTSCCATASQDLVEPGLGLFHL